nr:Ig-like domain-containing protein [Amycolatopsis marina]
MTNSAGTDVSGSLNTAGTRWTSTGELDFDTRYSVTAKSASGTKVARFTTASPAATAYPSIVPLDGETTGVDIPIIIEFSEPVTDRAAVLRNLRVTSKMPAEGAWRWFGDDEAHYRTKEYWPAYTTVTRDIGISAYTSARECMARPTAKSRSRPAPRSSPGSPTATRRYEPTRMANWRKPSR